MVRAKFRGVGMLLFLLMLASLRLAMAIPTLRWKAEKMGDVRSHIE